MKKVLDFSMLKLTFGFLIMFFSFAAPANELKIDTSPEGAEIFVKKNPDDEPVKIGNSPYSGKVEDVRQKFNLGQTFFLELRKEGHEPYHILLAPISKSKIELSFKLKISRDIELTKKFDSIANQLFEAQRLTRDKNFENALKILDEIEKEEKYLSITNEMKGGIYYLKKDFNTALSYYRKAFSINAENKDAYSMKLYLEKSLGINQ